MLSSPPAALKTWSKTKAMESCWGEDNMKVYTVNMKKAVAKCNQVDARQAFFMLTV